MHTKNFEIGRYLCKGSMSCCYRVKKENQIMDLLTQYKICGAGWLRNATASKNQTASTSQA